MSSPRYCHVYKKGELAALVASLPELTVLEEYYDTSNWCVVARKAGGAAAADAHVGEACTASGSAKI